MIWFLESGEDAGTRIFGGLDETTDSLDSLRNALSQDFGKISLYLNTRLLHTTVIVQMDDRAK